MATRIEPSSDLAEPPRQPPMRTWALIALGVLITVGIIAIALVLASRSPETATPTSVTTAPTPAPTTDPSTDPSTPVTTLPVTEPVEVTLYFSGEFIESSNAEGAHLIPVRRTMDVVVDATPADLVRAAVVALIVGPDTTPGETFAALSTAMPPRTEVTGVTVEGSRAAIDFSTPFENDGGLFTGAMRFAQVVFTATSIGSIEEVMISIDGLSIAPPFTRADFEDYLPLVLVESPLPGDAVTSPVTISGLANAFEANVALRVENAGGGTLFETFTTATCGTGCFGEFSEDLFFAVDEETAGYVVAFEYSARDGAPVNVYRVPVVLVPGGEAPPVVEPEPQARSYDIDVAALTPLPIEGSVVVDAVYGAGDGEVGLDPKGFGPCCFAVSGEGVIVLLDSQNSRLMKFDDGAASVLAEFDPSDFVADGIAVVRDRVVVVGMTNRPNRPYDAIVFSLATGEQIERGETLITINGDLRTTTDGVFWAAAASRPQWMALTDDAGNLLSIGGQAVFDELPGETSIAFTYDAGVEVVVRPAGDSAPTTFDVMAEAARFLEVLPYGGYADGVMVVAGSAFDERGVAQITAVEMGTDLEGNQVTLAFTFEMERTTDTGSFNTFVMAYGGLYVLNTGIDGITIVKYELN